MESVNGEKKHSQHTVTSENLKSASFHSCISVACVREIVCVHDIEIEG